MKIKMSLLTFTLLITSCATIINGPTENIPIATDPPGATVTWEQTNTLTPTKLTLDRKRDYVLTITKENYEPEHIKIVHVISGAEAGNIIFGLVGVAIDVASGSAWSLQPNNILVTLRPLSPEDKIDEDARLNEKTVQQQLKAIEQLKEEHLLTENQYMTIRTIIIRCITT